MSTTSSAPHPTPTPSQAQSTTTATTAPVGTSTPASSKPPLSISPTAYLDPSSYVLGTHPINIAASVLIHPRARIISSHCALDIGEGCIVTERCVVGGPASTTATLTTTTTTTTPPSETALANPSDEKTIIGAKVQLHPACHIHHGATVGSYSIVESAAEVLPGVKIGQHSKICAGVVVDRNVGDWEVVFGTGSFGKGLSRRRRRRRSSRAGEDAVEAVVEEEEARLRGLEGERVGTVTVLKMAQLGKAAAKRGK